jgi:disulfide bond formation protein DsbB
MNISEKRILQGKHSLRIMTGIIPNSISIRGSKMHISNRMVYAAIALGCFGLMAFGLVYLQGVKHLVPCPMCVMQRIAFLIAGLVALVAALHNPGRRGRIVYGSLIGIATLAGLTVALRQIYLIHYPHSFECGISPEEKILDTLPLANWWPAMFQADGNCAEVVWRFLDVTIPGWAVVAFGGILALTLWSIIAKTRTDY